MSQASKLRRGIDRDLAQRVRNASDEEKRAIRLKTDPAYARSVRDGRPTETFPAPPPLGGKRDSYSRSERRFHARFAACQRAGGVGRCGHAHLGMQPRAKVIARRKKESG